MAFSSSFAAYLIIARLIQISRRYINMIDNIRMAMYPSKKLCLISTNTCSSVLSLKLKNLLEIPLSWNSPPSHYFTSFKNLKFLLPVALPLPTPLPLPPLPGFFFIYFYFSSWYLASFSSSISSSVLAWVTKAPKENRDKLFCFPATVISSNESPIMEIAGTK